MIRLDTIRKRQRDELRRNALKALEANGWRILPAALDLGTTEGTLRSLIRNDSELSAVMAKHHQPRGRPRKEQP